MSISRSVVVQLLKHFPSWRPQMYFKSSLTALSHAMEDRVLASSDSPLIIASFQKERFYRQEAHRYLRIAKKSDQVYVLAAPEAEFKHSSNSYETIAFEATDSLAKEWHLIVIGEDYASCLVCREKTNSDNRRTNSAMDNSRRFEGIWTFDRQISLKAADLLLKRILKYRPELSEKIEQARQDYLQANSASKPSPKESPKLENNNPDPFVQRLVSYLQASHYKLLKANKSLAIKQQKEQLLNSVTDAIRRSLDTEEILQVAVQKLGEGLGVCRCIVYRCSEKDSAVTIDHEFITSGIKSVKGQTWRLKDNPLFEEAVELRDSLRIDNTHLDPRINQQGTGAYLTNLVRSCSIFSWLLVPVLYQDKLLGMLELHHCDEIPIVWKEDDVAFVDAIATQVGVALIQAESYANLEDLNEQLEALDRTRSNLVAITGHELRTPLSTIQVCLESLASEPDMSVEMRQIMLDTALADTERMRNLIQDFLTLSRLESGRVEWNSEPLSLNECIELAISNVRSRLSQDALPQIINRIPKQLPLVQADGEWLVEVLAKLLDNACKFTNSDGQITIETNPQIKDRLEVTITDTGRGIEPNRLETVFERFYQEEGALRRSAGGTGLGLAICRQIVRNWGGAIWAKSEGRDLGSQFHFTIPVFNEVVERAREAKTRTERADRKSKSQKKQNNPRKN